MRTHQNTLYITTQGAALHRDHQTLRVKVEGAVRLTVPMHHLDGVVCFGRVFVTPAVFGACADEGLSLSFLTEQGRFLARVEHPAHGNVLLRRQQYRSADDPARCLAIASPCIAAKIQNARNLLLRAARDGGDDARAAALRSKADHMAAVLADLPRAENLNVARGIEGETAKTYFDAFPDMIRRNADVFKWTGRNRRPPRDPVNALLSFLYALLQHDASSALQCVGLDPAVGFLHVDRPGRPSLALDLMEEFRPLIVDRLVLAMINRGQVKPKGFSIDPAGGVLLDDDTRRAVISAYQERKREEVLHPLLAEPTPIGLLPHIQARLLARAIRGEYPQYAALVLR